MREEQHKNKKFFEYWSEVRKVGMKAYVLNKIRNICIMLGIMYFLNILLNDKTSYIQMAVIYIFFAIVMPFASWEINEIRYQRMR